MPSSPSPSPSPSFPPSPCLDQSPKALGYVVLDDTAEVSSGEEPCLFRVKARNGAFAFVAENATEATRWHLGEWTAVHASPPPT